MSEIEDLKQRIDRIESRAAISELITAYAIACDEHDMPHLVRLFTEDACLDSPSGALVANGRAEIETMFIDVFKIRGPAFHWTHDHLITVDPDDADRATGLVLCHAETCPSGVASLAALRYYDNYRRENGKWLFARRELHFLYYVPMTQLPDALNHLDRVVVGGQRKPADYPEALPAWQAFHATHTD
ncbi:MAG: ketosteroid isomerase-like protein [Gammaproteobacteria bacterium]